MWKLNQRGTGSQFGPDNQCRTGTGVCVSNSKTALCKSLGKLCPSFQSLQSSSFVMSCSHPAFYSSRWTSDCCYACSRSPQTFFNMGCLFQWSADLTSRQRLPVGLLRPDLCSCQQSLFLKHIFVTWICEIQLSCGVCSRSWRHPSLGILLG